MNHFALMRYLHTQLLIRLSESTVSLSLSRVDDVLGIGDKHAGDHVDRILAVVVIFKRVFMCRDLHRCWFWWMFWCSPWRCLAFAGSNRSCFRVALFALC